jgi:ribose transport system permease protein
MNLTTRLVIPSFLVTVGMTGVARGLAMWVTDTAPVPNLKERYNAIVSSGSVGPLPTRLFWKVIVTDIGAVVLRKTTYGHQVLASGGNERAARIVGVDTRRMRFWFPSSPAWRRHWPACSMPAVCIRGAFSGKTWTSSP